MENGKGVVPRGGRVALPIRAIHGGQREGRAWQRRVACCSLRGGRREVAKLLFQAERFMDINAKAGHGLAALHDAAYGGHRKMAMVLLETHANHQGKREQEEGDRDRRRPFRISEPLQHTGRHIRLRLPPERGGERRRGVE